MSYAEALERLKKLPETPPRVLPKPTNTPFGSFGSRRVGHSEKITPGKSARLPTPEPAPKRARMENPISAPVLTLVRCGQCQHFEPNPNSPAQGLGRCRVGAEGESPPWPNALRLCHAWNSSEAALLEFCQDATSGTHVEPKALADWLRRQDDPGWMHPPAIEHWVKLIAARGLPNR